MLIVPHLPLCTLEVLLWLLELQLYIPLAVLDLEQLLAELGDVLAAVHAVARLGLVALVAARVHLVIRLRFSDHSSLRHPLPLLLENMIHIDGTSALARSRRVVLRPGVLVLELLEAHAVA